MMKRYMHGELAPDTPKKPNEPMAIDPNSKVNQGDMTGDGNDKKGKKIKKSMVKQYGKKKGEAVFYAMENSGKLKGVKKNKNTRNK